MAQADHLAGESPLTILGRRIRQAREVRGMTAHQLAALMAWSGDYIERLESGDRLRAQTMNLRSFIELSQALHVQIGYLVGEHDFIGKLEDTP